MIHAHTFNMIPDPNKNPALEKRDLLPPPFLGSGTATVPVAVAGVPPATRCETDFFAGRFLRVRSICDPIYSFGATFALSPRVRGESRREGTLFRHLKNFVSHPWAGWTPESH